MKLQILFTALLMFVRCITAESQSGIYLTIADYKSDKISNETTCNNKNGNIHLHDFFGIARYVTVKENSQKHNFKKSELYGYRDCNNEVYRFYKDAAYHIAEAGNIYIYTREQNVTQGKGFKVVNVYYFSVAPGSDILPLTRYDLKNAYNDNKEFLSLLDEYSICTNVSEYDYTHKTFKVNYLFAKTIRQ